MVADSRYTIHQGDCLDILPTLPAESVQCVVTSPPYYGLRDYGVDGQIGLEPTVDEYVARMVDVFRQVRRVLREDGTVWLNLGDSYGRGQRVNNPSDSVRGKTGNTGQVKIVTSGGYGSGAMNQNKQLIGIPWRVAFALQADGWWLRSDIIWHKPNPMPESVTDRPTKAHEYVFLLTKAQRYYYDADAVREGWSDSTIAMHANKPTTFYNTDRKEYSGRNDKVSIGWVNGAARFEKHAGRNRRSVWTVTTKPYSGAHFATMPPDLVEPCIRAGSKPGDVVLDPFNGSGTTGAVALSLGRQYVGIELNPDYIALAHERIQAAPLPLFPEAV